MKQLRSTLNVKYNNQSIIVNKKKYGLSKPEKKNKEFF
jgi:hypothetical protein